MCSKASKDKVDANLRDSVFVSSMSFAEAGMGAELPTKTHALRLLMFSNCFVNLILISAYTENMASVLVYRNQVRRIENIEDAIRNNFRICVKTRTDYTQRIENLYPTYQFTEKKDNFQLLSNLLNGECEIALMASGIYSSYVNDEHYNPYCNLEKVGSRVFVSRASFATLHAPQGCTELLLDALNIHLIEMEEDGTKAKLLKEYENSFANYCSAI